MKAYRIHSPNTVTLDEMDAQPVGENCIKIKNLVCGISTADFAVLTGKQIVQYPIIPVRQCVGFVSEVGESVSGILRGNRVVVYPQASCHNCRPCKEARFYDCEKPRYFGITEDGFLSDFSVVSADDVYVIPDRLKDEEAIYTEHTATAISVLSRLNVEKGEHIIIVGASTLGIILAQVAMYYQAVPIVVDMREDMLAVAQKAGVYYTINSVEEDVNKKVISLTGGHMANACAYIVSSTMPLRNSFDITAKHGRVALVGNSRAEELKVDLGGMLEKGIDLLTVTSCGKNYPSAINMLANRTVSVDMLPRHEVSFADAGKALDDGIAGNDEGKILVRIK